MITCTINGARRRLDVHPMKRALDVLREDCGLTGTKEGCGEGECGACTVLIDGEPVNSCLVPAAHMDGTEILTIEGVARGGELHALQEAFVVEGGAQCGICTPGMIMAALAIPRRATTAAIQEALAGNLCRCTGYEAIYRAVKKGAKAGLSRRSSPEFSRAEADAAGLPAVARLGKARRAKVGRTGKAAVKKRRAGRRAGLLDRRGDG
jgi:carbon-monoxide dehydrogenase small subunit